jgi:ribosomal protein L22
MAQEISARLTNLDTSAQKARLVVDLVRGKKVVQALNIRDVKRGREFRRKP